jgi:hypothetical protein
MADRVVKSAKEARDLYGSGLPEGHSVIAKPAGGGVIWSVRAVDEEGEGYVGVTAFVGEDGRVWTFSSNPRIHDYDLTRRVLASIYRDGSADQVDDDRLSDALACLTATVFNLVTELRSEASSGKFRAGS